MNLKYMENNSNLCFSTKKGQKDRVLEAEATLTKTQSKLEPEGSHDCHEILAEHPKARVNCGGKMMMG